MLGNTNLKTDDHCKHVGIKFANIKAGKDNPWEDRKNETRYIDSQVYR